MKKNIVILGSPRSGKSYLATLIKERYKYEYINGDNIINAYIDAFHNQTNEIAHLNLLKSYIKQLNSDLNFYIGSQYVIESNIYNNIVKLIEGIDRDKNLIIGLVYDKMNSEQIYNYLKENNSKFDMQYYLADVELKMYSNMYALNNQELSKLFNNYNITKFDVSENREEVLEVIPYKIKTMIK